MGSCVECSDNSFSIAGSVTCDFCAAQFYSFEGSCLDCPAGTACDVDGINTLATLPLVPGFWRIQDATTVIRSCPMPLACDGGSEFADKGDSYCREGFTGPLCSVCLDGYFFEPDTVTCTICEGGQLEGVITSTPIMAMMITLGTVLLFSIIFLIIKYNVREEEDDDFDEDFEDEEEVADEMYDKAAAVAEPIEDMVIVVMPAATECRDHLGTINDIKGIPMARTCHCGNTFKHDTKFCRECGDRRPTMEENKQVEAKKMFEENERKKKERMKKKLRKARRDEASAKAAAADIEIKAAIFNATAPENVPAQVKGLGRMSFGFGKGLLSKSAGATGVVGGASARTEPRQLSIKTAKRRKTTFDQDLEDAIKYIMSQKKAMKKMQTKLKAFMAFSQM